MENRIITFVYIIVGILSLVNLILFWRLCKDIHTLLLHFTQSKETQVIFNKNNEDNVNKPLGSKTPGKTDVQEFRSKVKQFCKSNKDPKSQKEFIDNLVAEYNSIFNEDFSQYLD